MACDGDAKFITRDALTVEDCSVEYANFCEEVMRLEDNRTSVADAYRQ